MFTDQRRRFLSSSGSLIRYTAGDTVSGEAFTRASTARFKDTTGVYPNAAVNAKRIHNLARSNTLPYSHNDPGWTGFGTTLPNSVNGNVTIDGLVCVESVFPIIAGGGFAVCRAGGTVGVKNVVNGRRFIGRSKVKLSRALTGAEVIQIYFTGAQGSAGAIQINAAKSLSYLSWNDAIEAVSTLGTVTGNNNLTIFPITLNSPLTVWITERQMEFGTYVNEVIPTSGAPVTVYGGLKNTGLFLEGLKTNICLWSRDLSNIAWTVTGTGGPAVLNLVGLDGTANTGCTLTDTDAAVITAWSQTFTVTNDNAVHCLSVHVKKDAVANRFPEFKLSLSVGVTPVVNAYALNTQTGELFAMAGNGAGTTGRIIDDGNTWIVELTTANNTSGNTTLTISIAPAAQTVIGTDNIAATGSVGILHVQVELNSPFYSSPIFTTTASVSRATDLYRMPAPLPQEMTIYADIIQFVTTDVVQHRLLHMGQPSDTLSAILYTGGNIAWICRQANGVAASSSGPIVEAIGDEVELRGLIFADGSTQIGITPNNGTESLSVRSGVVALAAAWFSTSMDIGSNNLGTPGFYLIKSIKILAGIRTLADMRAA